MADNDKKKYYWLKLEKDFFQKYKIRSLISEKNGEKNLIIYQQLMCECLNYVDEKNNGILRFSQDRPYTINELASVINRKPKELQEALETLINKELLEVWEDGTICIYGVNVGSISGQTLRKNSGKNVVKTTEELPKNYRNKTVKTTLEYRDKSKEIRDKKYIYKGSVELVAALNDFEEMRKKIKKPLTDRAKQQIVKKLNEISNDEETQIRVLEQSITNCWLSVYPLKEVRQDKVSVYDSSLNKNINEQEEEELLKMLGKA